MMRVTKWLFSFWCLWACVATALADEDMPYVRTQEVSADAKVVRLFFMFSCPHCHSADKALLDWGNTLPASLIYARTPVVVKDDGSVLGAIAYYTALTTSPKNINSYCEIVFRLIHQQGFTADKKETYFFAAKTAKLNMTEFYRHWGDEQVMSMFTYAAKLSSTYQIQLTPTLVVGGRYAISPETVSGNMGSFIQLANAVVSKRLQE